MRPYLVSENLEPLYNLLALRITRRTYVAALTVLVAAFVALYPYLGSAGLCMGGGCPYATQAPPSGGSGASCPIVMLAAAPVALAFAAFFGRRVAADGSRPVEVHLTPEPPPPRPFL